MDDGYAIGPAEILFPAIEKFARDIEERCLLVWEKSKTEVFSWNGILPPNSTPGLTRAGCYVGEEFEPGFLCYGVPVGTDRYVEHMLEKKVEDIAKSAKNACETLDEERQALWAVLRLSLSQQLDYWLQLCYPSNIRAAAEKVDSILWNVLETTAFSKIPRAHTNLPNSDTVKISIDGLQDSSFQERVVRQPIKMGGFGLRCQADLSPIAYIGAIEQILPSFVGTNGVCPQLAHVIGSMDNSSQRWQTLISSGCRTGKEFANSWNALQTEATIMCNFLDLNLETPLSVSVEGGGEGSMNGSTRKRIVEQRETLRGSVLTSALEHYSDQTARPVLVWPQKDKLSSAWLLALPGPVTGLTSPIFSEAVCSSLCLPSPSCR